MGVIQYLPIQISLFRNQQLTPGFSEFPATMKCRLKDNFMHVITADKVPYSAKGL